MFCHGPHLCKDISKGAVPALGRKDAPARAGPLLSAGLTGVGCADGRTMKEGVLGPLRLRPTRCRGAAKGMRTRGNGISGLLQGLTDL